MDFVNEIILERLRTLLKARLGIIIPPSLSPRILRKLQDYVDQWPGGWSGLFIEIDEKRNDLALKHLADIFVITHTYFFREHIHFEFFKNVILPDLQASKEFELRIWSAASSSGEEAYSILLSMIDFFGDDYWFLDAGVLATDISRQALEKGVTGAYSADALKNVPKPLAEHWFNLNDEGSVMIDERLRKEVTFRWLNLVDPFPAFRRPFHVIFCRNVMLYFEEEMRSAVIEKLSRSLAPGGWLIIGQAEDSRAARNWLEPVSGSIYRKSNLG